MTTHADQIERARLATDAAVVELQQLAIYEPSRALSLAITNAQQAAMWHGWHDGEQGRYVSPFPTHSHEGAFQEGGVVAVSGSIVGHVDGVGLSE